MRIYIYIYGDKSTWPNASAPDSTYKIVAISWPCRLGLQLVPASRPRAISSARVESPDPGP